MRHLAANISSPKVREIHDHFLWRKRALYMQNTGETNSKANTWLIANTQCKRRNLQSYLFQTYISLNPSRGKQNYTLYFY